MREGKGSIGRRRWIETRIEGITLVVVLTQLDHPYRMLFQFHYKTFYGNLKELECQSELIKKDDVEMGKGGRRKEEEAGTQ